MRALARRWTDNEIAELRGLWGSLASDDQLVAWFGRHRSCIRRVAMERLGLPPRVTARALAFAAQAHLFRIVP